MGKYGFYVYGSFFFKLNFAKNILWKIFLFDDFLGLIILVVFKEKFL